MDGKIHFFDIGKQIAADLQEKELGGNQIGKVDQRRVQEYFYLILL